MNHVIIIIALAALAACDNSSSRAFSRFADKEVHCVDAKGQDAALCKRKDGAAFVCFVEHRGSTVYCIRAVDPLDYKPASLTPEAL